MSVLFLDLARRAEAERADLEDAFAAVLERGRFVGGPALERFEAEFAAYCGVGHCVGVNSGTDALALALRARGIGPGDEVITAANTCVATITGIVGAGATPVLADVDPDSWTLDPASVERAVTPRTRAVVPVHLYGQVAELDYGLPLVEDAAQAVGAEPRRGPLAAYSFYPTKNLGALGDGGAVVTEDAEVAEQLRMLRSHGERAEARGVGVVPGVNSRLDEVQAEILSRRLAAAGRGNERRRQLAELLPRRAEGRQAPGRARGDAPLLAPVRRAGRGPRRVPSEAARARRRDARPLPRTDPPPARLDAPRGLGAAGRQRAPLRAGGQPPALPRADGRRGRAGRRGGERDEIPEAARRRPRPRPSRGRSGSTSRRDGTTRSAAGTRSPWPRATRASGPTTSPRSSARSRSACTTRPPR